jgi:guanylate kinase
MILTISGGSGVGKSSLLKLLLTRLPQARIATSVSTRAPRQGEALRDLHHVSDREFAAKRTAGEFLWVAQVHGNSYATRKALVIEGLQNQDSWLLLDVAPGIVPIIAALPSQTERSAALKTVYVVSPAAVVVRARLLARGDDAASIDQRMRDCADWDSTAIIHGNFGLYIQGAETLVHNVEKIVQFALS